MAWWPNAVYDTCSLITIDKLLQIDADLGQHFVGITALEVSFTIEQMREEIAARMNVLAAKVEMPSPERLIEIFREAQLSKALAEVDRLVYATAVAGNLAVVTGDKRLAKALNARGVTVGNVAMILKTLVMSRKLKRTRCTEMLLGLAERKDFLLGKPDPKWSDLEGYSFP